MVGVRRVWATWELKKRGSERKKDLMQGYVIWVNRDGNEGGEALQMQEKLEKWDEEAVRCGVW